MLVASTLLVTSRTIGAQECSGVPTTDARRVVALQVDGHAYGTSRFAVGGLKPFTRHGAWVSVGVGRTSDAALLLRSLTVQMRGEWPIRLPFGTFLCPSVAASGATADDRATDNDATFTWLDTDLGLTLGRHWRVREDLGLAVAVRGRTGETRARRTSPVTHTIDDRWRFQVLEAFVGVNLHARLLIRPSVTYFRYRMSDPLSVLQPLARADRELGAGILLGFAF